jgi:hypothetical protein
MVDFNLGSNTSDIIKLVPVLNQDFTFVANQSIKIESENNYNSYESTTAKIVTDPNITHTRF